jgi:type IV pilus assembly protein PilM
VGYGVDLGSSALKVVAVRRALGGYKVVGVARRRVAAGRAAAGDPKGALLKLLFDAIGPRNGQRAGVVGLSGRDINLQLVQQPNMKPLNYRVMMGYELEQRRGEATDLYLDYCTLREPDPYFPQYLALVGIGKNSYVDDRIDLLARTGLDVRDAVPNAFALYSAYRNAYEVEGGTVLLLDVGSDNMDMAFVRGGRLIFARNVSSGARVFDHQLANALGVPAEEAEQLKVEHGNLGPAAEDADEEKEGEIRGPVRSAAGQLMGFITSSINHAKVQLNDRELVVDKIYLSGGGARLRGLPEYLSGAVKVPVELLDPFRKLDTSAIDRQGGEEARRLPTDLAVAVGLGQLVSPTPAAAAATLSILPDRLKRRRNYFRTTFWLAAAGGALAATLLALTVLAFIRKSAEEGELESYRAKTADVKKRIDEMEAIDREQRELSAKVDWLVSQVSGGRVALDVVARLKKALPAGVTIHEIRLGDPPGRRDRRDLVDADRWRVAFTAKRRGLVIGELDGDFSGREIKLKGHPDPFTDEDVVDGIEQGVLRWPASARAVLVAGEVDENIRGGALEALNGIRDQLTDPSRGVKASILPQRPSDRRGWRVFEILVSFE